MASLLADYNFSKRYTGTCDLTIRSSMGFVPTRRAPPGSEPQPLQCDTPRFPQPGIDAGFCPCICRPGRLQYHPVSNRRQKPPMPVRQLPEQVVNRIAAGEVVERPASVVKELVENAIDAGASRVDIFTDGGGRRRIGITDDGGGMTHGDLTLAVDRHATSKLDDEDLLRIRTLGFRGEALPSIGAVAKLGITTRHASEPHARSLSVEGGEKSPLMPAALSQGTRVEVSDLFYATPARLKFLKTDRTEAEAIREVVRRLAMARPDIAFTLAGEERAPV